MSRRVFTRDFKVAAIKELSLSRRNKRPRVERTIDDRVREEAKGIASLCRTAKVSRAGSYLFIKPRQASAEELKLRDAIQKISLEMSAYGYRRVTGELRKRGWALITSACDE